MEFFDKKTIMGIIIILSFGVVTLTYILFYELDDEECKQRFAEKYCKENGYNKSSYKLGYVPFNCIKDERRSEFDTFYFTEEELEECKRGFI